MTTASVDVSTRGPLFDGRAAAAVEDFLDESERTVAELGVNEVKARLGQVLQNETGFYRSKVATDRVREDVLVTDGGVVYGPWLEGTSSRNETTRFKGYTTFRKTAQWVDARAGSTAEGILRRFVGRMGGS